MPCAWKPSTRACWQSARTLSRLSWALAVRTILRAASASRTFSARASRSSAVITARPACSAYVWSTRRCASSGRLPLTGRSMARVPRSTPCSSVSGAMSRSSGCQASGSSIGVTSGIQPQVSPALGSRRSCGTNRSRPQWSAFSISAIRVSMGVRRPWSSIRASSLPATAATSSLPSSRATLIAATPNPARSVTPSAISWRASREGPSDQIGRTGGSLSSDSRDISGWHLPLAGTHVTWDTPFGDAFGNTGTANLLSRLPPVDSAPCTSPPGRAPVVTAD